MGVSLTSAIPIFITNPGMTIARFALDSAARPRVTTSSTGTCHDCPATGYARFRSPRDLVELRPHRSGTERGHGYRRVLQLPAQRFGKTRHVSFGRRVNRDIRHRKKTGRRADIQNRAALSVPIMPEASARQPREGDHVDEHHFFHAVRVRCRERPAIAKPGVVDQQIDRDFFALDPFTERRERCFV